MCQHELIGDYYRGCGHFHGRYYTGDVIDCNTQHCKTSKSHMHKTAPNCGCPEVMTNVHRVQNLFHSHHPDCERAGR